MGVTGQVVIGKYGDEMAAHLARHRLDAEGIESWLVDENMASVYPLYNQVIGGVKIAVAENDAAVASDILKGMEPGADAEPIACPACGSTRVVENSITFLWAVLLTLATFGLYLPVFHRKKRCEDCGGAWR